MQVMYAPHQKAINVMLSGQSSQVLAHGFGPMMQNQVKGVNRWDI
jgi:hypothetical protein